MCSPRENEDRMDGKVFQRAANQDAYPRISDSFLKLVQFVQPNPGMVFNDNIARATSDSLATARALAKILPTVNRLEDMPAATRGLYLSKLTPDQFQDTCRDDICRLAKESAERLVAEDGQQRNIAYRSALACISEVYAESLSERFASLTKELNQLKKGKKEDQTAFLDYASTCEKGPLLEGFTNRMEHVTKALLYPGTEAAEPDTRPGY